MDTDRRPSAFQTILNMFRLSNAPTVPMDDDEMTSDIDEPPDRVSELNNELHRSSKYSKSTLPPSFVRRESLLTKAFHPGSDAVDMGQVSSRTHNLSRALSTASSQSVPSTAELTSDCELNSPARSVSPSPPPPSQGLSILAPRKQPTDITNKVIIAPVTKDDRSDVVEVGEAAVEKTLGRKRCIMFACADKPVESPKPEAATKETATKETATVVNVPSEKATEPQPRKSRLTFACPTRQDSTSSVASAADKTSHHPPPTQKPSSAVVAVISQKSDSNLSTANALPIHQPSAKKPVHSHAFHEFGSSQDETDSWIDQPAASDRPKLTITDVMQKELAIRRIAEEAEQEADAEEQEQEELENELDEENDGEDDFAPSDDDKESDGGNESDDENGFAESDDESDAGSDYQFWAPATTTAATSVDNMTHFSVRQRSRSSSLDSTPSQSSANRTRIFNPRRASKSRAKAIRMRPGTPELPDSTDFVCGTLDEDRPLEAAFIACREQKKREKHVLIPQDIDPSFPTTDPEDEESDDEAEEDESEPAWLRDQFGAMDDDERGRRPSAIRLSPSQMLQLSQRRPAAVTRVHRSPPPPRLRSPPPKRVRSPPPRRLFGHSPPPKRSSPSHHHHYRSPRGSPTNSKMPIGITINRLAQRPNTDQTASLPHTANPFFSNWKRGSPVTSCIPSGAVTPGTDEAINPDLHVRGPVDIVIGLEKKRQKRKEKYWRQHCRKAAKEHAERKTVPGRGAERMKELGLECAERTRGYGLGQQAKLVLSL